MARTPKKPRAKMEERYRSILTLGAGGMGEIVLAVAKGGFNVNKLVVLKTLRKELVAEQCIRKMFLEEACLSARLAHPNVVQIHKVVPAANPIIVMEYLDGQPLSTILGRAGVRFSTAMQLRIFSSVLEGLHYSHELRDYDGTPLNIVHRDVSPQNVFVTYEGLVKILDFGLAKVATRRSRTKSGTIKGKLEYMPVEQMMGGEVDRRADIYALGCVLWHACAGERLWANESEASILRNLMTGNIPRPSTRRPVHPRLEAIVMKALAFDPKDRYQTALEMQTAIDEFLLQMRDATSTHDIATFVSELFAEQRNALSEVIRVAMEKPQLLPPRSDQADRTKPEPWFTVQRRWTVRALGTAGIIAAMLVLGGAGVRQLVPHNGTANANGEAGIAALTPRFVTLRVSVSPRNAVLTVDHWPTHENPVTLRLPQDDREHEIRAAFSGYETMSKLVRLKRDISLDLVLQPSAVPEPLPPVRPSSADSSQHQQKKRRATNDPVSDCNPPYYYSSGVKLFKPECL